MRQVDIATLVAYVTALVAAAGAVRTHVARRRLLDTTARMTANLEQAARDRAFAKWANWTMLTVTDSKGYVHAATVSQIYYTGKWDNVWDAPVAVAVWHGDPDVVDRYQAELTHEHDQEEEQRG